jgi:hypothetical protein
MIDKSHIRYVEYMLEKEWTNNTGIVCIIEKRIYFVLNNRAIARYALPFFYKKKEVYVGYDCTFISKT